MSPNKFNKNKTKDNSQNKNKKYIVVRNLDPEEYCNSVQKKLDEILG